MRTLALPPEIAHWSLTSLRERLIKIGAKLVLHARSISASTPGLGLEAGTSATKCLPDGPPVGIIIACGPHLGDVR
jgi:hypothetical protein